MLITKQNIFYHTGLHGELTNEIAFNPIHIMYIIQTAMKTKVINNEQYNEYVIAFVNSEELTVYSKSEFKDVVKLFAL